MTGRGVYRLADIIGDARSSAGLPDGRWVRAVPEPFYGLNFSAAWEVLRGRAHAIQWPKHGELERALERGTEKRAT